MDSVEEENEDIADLKLRNDDSEAQVENLINLPYLHEPAILHCLEQRYNKSDIYTYTGPILIAMNPFKSVPLYTNQILEVYYNMGLLKSQGIEGGAPLPPHVYAIADAAYREMMNTIMQGYGTTASFSGKGSTASANHAILISGESGAGKTESTKIVLRYLTTVGSSSGGLGAATGSVMEKVLQSNPILEAFGNAKTIRNDNSSRFGKYIELNFNKRGHLIGGTISTYLLEKVRLPVQQNGERNFHIFYQILSGATLDEYKKWQLLSFEEFRYTSQGGVYSLKHIDDKQEYLELKKALTTLNFTESDQVELLDIVAGLLHFGQLQFIHEEDGEGSRISANVLTQNSLALTSQLCGLDVDELVRALTVRKIVARSESYEIRLSPIQASDARDAFCKAIYGRIFEWIVVTINRSIQIDEKLVRANIGVLDIFGFECFEYNSFEQLCINYTNETLQQQFNQYIFKMEQIEYKNEQIEWSFIEFPDNQDCLDLIEHKVTGILAMIDDECRLPKASDERLAGRMYKSYENNSRFTATAPHKRDYKFCINHYAGSVVYSTITFVDKNRDELPKEASNLLGKSCNSLISGIFALKQSNGKTLTNNKAVVPTAASASVGTQFKEQLHKLMEKIYTTMPHYIRCLKPNDQNVPDNFDRFRITEQLRYGGVLEAVRVARSGFPVRLNHLDFYARYRPLANPLSSQTSTLPMFLTKKILDSKKQSIKEYCEKLLEAIWDTTDTAPSEKYNGRRKSIAEDIKMWKSKVEVNLQSIQLGLTKVFLRKTAHDLLEGRRSRRILSAVRRIQSIFRRYIIRSWYCKVLESTALLQRVTRGMIARKLAMSVKNKYAATKLQTAFRMYFWRKRYFRIHHAILLLQSMHRRKKSSRLVVAIRLQFQSTRLQRLFRGLLRRKIWRSFRWALIILQNRWRKCMAKALYRKMRLEAKDVGRLQQSNEALKNEIEKLKAKASEDARNLQLKLEREAQQHASVAKNHEIDSLKVEVKELNEKLLIEKHTSRDLETQLRETEKELARCKQELTEAYARIDFLEASGFRGTEAVSMVSKGISSPLDSSPRSRKKFVLDTASPLVEPKDGNNDDSSLPDGLDPNRRISASLNSSSAVHDFEAQYHKALKDLENEITAKEILEEEVSRLRHLSMDLKAQIDSSRRPSIQKKDEVLSPTRRSSTNSEASKNVLDKTLHRRPSANPKSLSSLQKLADQSLWSSTWDEGDDSSVSRSMMSSSTSDELESRKAQVVSDSKNLSRNQPEMVRTVNAFEKNLESFRHKLKHVSGFISLLEFTI